MKSSLPPTQPSDARFLREVDHGPVPVGAEINSPPFNELVALKATALMICPDEFVVLKGSSATVTVAW